TRADDKLFYPAYNDWVSGTSTFDKDTGAGILPSAGLYNTERKLDAVDGYVDGRFRLFGQTQQVMGGIGYNKRDYPNIGDHQVGWTALLGYPDGIASFPEPDWNPLTLQSRGSITQKAAYAATRLSLADPLKLILGARYTDWKSEGEGADRSHRV